MSFLIQRAFPALCLIALLGCSSPICRQWEIQEIVTKLQCFNGGRLLLSPDSDYSHLELEIVRNASGIRFYINLLFLQALPWKDDSSLTSITIQLDNQAPWIIYPYLLEGGQRLLLPEDAAETLVQALLAENSFTIQIGRNQINVISTNFITVYQRLLDLPIEEKG